MADIQYIDPAAILRLSPLISSHPELDVAEPKLDLPLYGIDWGYFMHHDGRYRLKLQSLKRVFGCTHPECSSRWLRLSLCDERFTGAGVLVQPYVSGVKDSPDVTVCLRLSRYRKYFDTETLVTVEKDGTSNEQQQLEQLLQRKTSQLGIIDLAALVRQAVQDGLIKPTAAYEPGQKTEFPA